MFFETGEDHDIAKSVTLAFLQQTQQASVIVQETRSVRGAG